MLQSAGCKLPSPLQSDASTYKRLDPLEDWENVMRSEETKIELFGRKAFDRVWMGENAELYPKITRPTVKHGGGNNMVCGDFPEKRTGQLVCM